MNKKDKIAKYASIELVKEKESKEYLTSDQRILDLKAEIDRLIKKREEQRLGDRIATYLLIISYIINTIWFFFFITDNVF